MAVKSDALLKWKNQQGRDLIRDYESSISGITPLMPLATVHRRRKTFEACRNAVVELKDLVTRA